MNHSLQHPVFALNLRLFFWLPGRTISASGATGPFRAFPKSLSVDFGGLNHPQAQPLPQSLSQQQQQQPGGVGQTTTTAPVSGSNASDRYAAVLQLDSVFSDATPTTGREAFEFRVDGFSIRYFTKKKPRSCNGVLSLELQWRTFFHHELNDRWIDRGIDSEAEWEFKCACDADCHGQLS